ncbi:MAG: integrase [Lysobacteraceae bacterium]|nr:MAG: integrase [Xanthomonadaceae bacterium]
MPTAPTPELLPLRVFKELTLPISNECEDLLGVNGIYRNLDPDRPPLIRANNDLEAVRCFLVDKARVGSPHTVRAYEKECIRLLLFCRYFALKPMSSLDRSDALNYEIFLRSPPKSFVQPRVKGVPVNLWLPNGTINPHWRPFRSAHLSDSSVKAAIAAVKSLSTYLINADYLRASAFQLGRLTRDTRQAGEKKVERVLGRHAKQAIDAVIAAMPEETERQRLKAIRARYTIDLFYYLGLRISEVAGGTMGDFYSKRNQWWFRTIGKGKKERHIPVPDALLRTLVEYRRILGVPGDYPVPSEETPLLLSIRGTKGVGENQIYRSTKSLFARAHDYLEERLVSLPSSSESSEMASDLHALKHASAHWLRHTYATDLVDAGLSIRLVKENMGHASLDTTLGYDHSNNSVRHHETLRIAKRSET